MFPFSVVGVTIGIDVDDDDDDGGGGVGGGDGSHGEDSEESLIRLASFKGIVGINAIIAEA